MKRVGAIALGVIVGLVLLEAMLRPLASVQLPPPPDIARDVLAGPLVESRQIEEGIQTSRFTAGGSRWTGSQPVDGAPMVVIIGDSYVVAREVADAETMGAWVERLSRNDGKRINVRQYGWRAARPAQYAHVARDVVRRWSPEKVIVVLADNDFDARALTDTMLPPPAQAGLARRSSLLMLIRHRQVLLDARAQHSLDRWKRRLHLSGSSAVNPAPTAAVDTAPTEQSPMEMADWVVEALARQYGRHLAILYVANTRLADGSEVNEGRLLNACIAQKVQCVSTRSAMRELERRGIVARGFSTTTLGSGHLNRDGHEMMGQLIWSMIR